MFVWPGPYMIPNPDHKTIGRRKEIKSLTGRRLERITPLPYWKGIQGFLTQRREARQVTLTRLCK